MILPKMIFKQLGDKDHFGMKILKNGFNSRGHTPSVSGTCSPQYLQDVVIMEAKKMNMPTSGGGNLLIPTLLIANLSKMLIPIITTKDGTAASPWSTSSTTSTFAGVGIRTPGACLSSARRSESACCGAPCFFAGGGGGGGGGFLFAISGTRD